MESDTNYCFLFAEGKREPKEAENNAPSSSHLEKVILRLNFGKISVNWCLRVLLKTAKYDYYYY